MPNWFHEVLSDLDAVQVGIYYDGDDSVVETLPDRTHALVYSGVRISNASYLEDGWISFYEYGSMKYGAVNCSHASIWFLRGEPVYCGRGCRSDSIAVQIGSALRLHAAADGAVLDCREVFGEVVALGDRWELTEHDRKVSLSLSGDCIYSFEPRESVYGVFESEGYLTMIERQGFIRVVDLAKSEVIFERQASEGSEYRRAAVTKSGLLTYTHHYFDRPKTTITHQRALCSGEDLNTKEIPLSGRYHLRNRGLEIFFATCAVYCTTSATHLLDARTANG